ncbi:ATP-dependent helicase HrpA [Propionibacterium freudenreichii]|uniref:ATP-dependent RNA helicase HrpA n=1 Tax=Propionibacterium freudenreichii TaxID=1744 RepID=UPI000BC321F0|nr:ATP-dependent RNA helicase HrpA [Propionibacterium freudenreichii]SBN59902.1 ATP-dependent helicase HrpA [Propionibacterium freudenreichii]SCQ48342.1 ATP-dependent helicase HrpA [Propionibacterium freudenreichii]SCQ53040.1 ATP-dependent helicase HrpA [Propionibacterium freudenreichii]
MSQPSSTAVEPQLSYDPALPISAHVDQIAGLIRDHQVVIVAGETGSGKTTQLPKICLGIGRRHIGHTQPRRIAARTVAERLAEEMHVPLGDTVGYQVRFTKQVGRNTAVKVMTDGVLLAEINHDRTLRRYDTLIIDEAHERSLNIDFLLGYLKQLLPRRRDLKVIITSATIDTQRFAEHFSDAHGRPAPIVEVSGRSYPVEMRYRPLGPEGTDEGDEDISGGIVQAVRELGPTGDVLVFLSGEREIKDADKALRDARLANTEVMPLFARLSAAEQHRVFQAHTGRRVILATNIAETSLTVPGIMFVVDTGLARISRYSARTKVQRLPIEEISRASADQRAGRCGRIAPGICIRLYSEEDYLARPEFTEPEILRTNLASVILKMAQADLGNIETFPFLEAPDRAQIRDGLRLLEELGALAAPGAGGEATGGRGQAAPSGKRARGHKQLRLTRTGHRLAELPIDPRLGRMLIEGAKRGCLREVEVIVSALAIQDVRERPVEKREQADQLHRRFFSDDILKPGGHAQPAGESGSPRRYTAHTGRAGEFDKAPIGPGGDIIAITRLWRYLKMQRKELSGNQFRRRCRAEFINFLRVREWQDLRTQLRQIDKELKLNRNERAGDVDQVLISVLSGLLSHIGLLEQKTTRKDTRRRGTKQRRASNEYLGARGSRFAIQPGSALSKQPPELLMAVELVETSRLWARTVAEVQAEWIEQVGAHQLRHNYSEPHWSSSAAGVLAYERVTLYGVPIIADRLADYARVDPQVARDIFIRSGLVEDGWVPDDTHAPHDFLEHNRQVRAQVEELEERTRRHDLLVDDQTIFDFYDERIPADVHSAASFDAWWSRQADHHLLDLDVEAMMRPDADGVDGSSFPDHWQVGELKFPVSYVFDPGSGSDGVTVTIPLAQLNQVSAQPFSWQVPGLRGELATELIRSLPKSVRTNFVPAPDRAREALRWLRAHEPDRNAWFHDELGRALRAITSVPVASTDWNPRAVSGHLQVSFQVTDAGRVVRTGKDLTAIRDELAATVTRTLTAATNRASTPTGTTWVFGAIDPVRQITRQGLTVKGYPALRDDGNSVSLVTTQTPADQARSHRAGVRRLLLLAGPDPTKWVVARIGRDQMLWLSSSPYESMSVLLADARLKTVGQSAERFTDPAGVRDEADFDKLLVEVRQVQADQMRSVVDTTARALSWARQVRADLANAPRPTADDVGAQVDNLVFPGFMSFTRDPWFAHLPRYLQGASLRLDAAAANPARDAQSQEIIDELLAEYDELCDAQPSGPLPDAVDDIGFAIEELRVQLFAQRLGTSQPVSPKRIRKMIARVRGADA